MPRRKLTGAQSAAVSKAASIIARLRWDSATDSDRAAAAAAMAAGRAKLPKAKRKAIAAKAAAAISQDAARARALKAWQTRRKQTGTGDE